MDKNRTMKRPPGWLLVAGVLVVLTVVVVLVALKGPEWKVTGAEWSQAIIQGLVALGGLWYAAYRSRPRVTLHLRIEQTLVYLDLANIGNRVARQVKVKCDPPIPLKKTLGPQHSHELFGLCESFGDMDRGQRYEMAVGKSMGSELADELDKATFTVSHKSTWGVQAA